MNPHELFCPNLECPARGQKGKGNIQVHSQKEKRCLCNVRGQTFAVSVGTIFYRLRHAPELVIQVEELDMVSRQYFKKLEDTEGIWEVRVQVGGDIFRLLGFFERGNLLILVSGFAKKTQKTPPQEIALALQRKEDHLSRRR